MIRIFLALIIFFFSLAAQARELCDCYGTCVPVYPRYLKANIKKMIKARDGFKPYEYAEIDHKIPLCLGGTNNPDNLQALTKADHKKKTEHDLLLLYYVKNCLMTIQEAQRETVNWEKSDSRRFELQD